MYTSCSYTGWGEEKIYNIKCLVFKKQFVIFLENIATNTSLKLGHVETFEGHLHPSVDTTRLIDDDDQEKY